MKKQLYQVVGMTCNNCVQQVKEALIGIPGVQHVEVRLEYPQVEIESPNGILFDKVEKVLEGNSKYSISQIISDLKTEEVDEFEKTSFKPLFIIVAFILGVSILSQFPFEEWDWMLWMRHFMAGFFLTFSFFKLLNVSGFASSYAMYDIVAQRWKRWGYIYPFVELFLGIAYLINFAPLATNTITFFVLGVSSIGVIQSNLNKRKIKCACLGDVFNLPMSTITIIEDVTMVAMAAFMIYYHLA